ncbi:MAG: transcription-repair coupling factor [Spirochaetaceae bacterium]
MITLFTEAVTAKLKDYPPYKTLASQFRGRNFPIEAAGPKGSFLALILSRLYEQSHHPFLLTVPTEQEARNLQSDLELFGVAVEPFPWWQTLAYRPTPHNSDVFGRRSRALGELLAARRAVHIAPLRSLSTPVPPPEYLRSLLFTVKRGAAFDPVSLGDRLGRYGYSRVPRVSVRGEYALRGEVLDIFLAGHEEPVRIVFEFDEVERITFFDPLTQSSTKTVDQVDLLPMREVVWDEERIETLARRLAALPEIPDDGAAVLEALRTHGWFSGEELYYPLAFEEPGMLVDYLSPYGTVVFADYERLVSSADALVREYDGLYRKARGDGNPPRPERILLPFEDSEQRREAVMRFHVLQEREQPADAVFSYAPPRSFFGNVDFLKEELSGLESAGYDIFVFADSERQAHRIEHMLGETTARILPHGISQGFSAPDLRLCVIEENEIFGRRKRVPRSVKRVQSREIDTFVELNPGDHVVHVNYGIGRFEGIQRMRAAGNERDYIKLTYAGEESVFIPLEQVNLVQRYIGHGGESPRLDRLGGKSWEKRKNKVRHSVEDLAERLVKLYSRRQKAHGFAFGGDTEWQLDFEADFPYEETEDQLRCIEEVKQDMERPAPMDRMICGDVGYGKTEVALRAAFKAVTAGKQVAFLAPTTILAEQHYETITERVAKFPVRAAMLSRFIPRSRQRTTLTEVADGGVDILVGTHRILQKDVRFRDLGLLVIDEEQRFGVKDKERLKELKASVDSLTLTATPIPRTLHMSLLKIRDMSVLNTPPRNRRPIETFIEEFDEEKVAEAVRREVSRGGQVYYLHNRVETLEHVKRFLERLLPEVLIETAHGQMSSQELEDKMHRFVHGGFQVLVSTTIIENGIDIPNVNTIIIDRADMYGISQLYQLRGRVGRSERLAYAYLFYPEKRALSELAMKRLQVVSDFTELGSGFKIALKDLEVRGAGNLLGREQSGDILSVGFDMYLKLLDEAIRELEESEEEEGPPEPYLELEYTGYIPDSYISEPVEKMEVYKKIAAVGTEEELEAVHGELEDRFGPLPDEVNSLLSLAEIRIICKKLYVSSLKERKGVVEIEFSKLAVVSPDRVLELIQAGGGKVGLDPNRPQVLRLETGTVGLKEKSEFIRSKLSSLL